MEIQPQSSNTPPIVSCQKGQPAAYSKIKRCTIQAPKTEKYMDVKNVESCIMYHIPLIPDPVPGITYP